MALVKLIVTERERDVVELELARLPTMLVTGRAAVIEVTRAARLADSEHVTDADLLPRACRPPHLGKVIRGRTAALSWRRRPSRSPTHDAMVRPA